MIEEWKTIEEYPNYMISNLGRVKSLYTYKVLKPSITKGYYFVSLVQNGNKENVRIHRLVAKAFLDNPNNYNVVNHKNENKLDNRVENLEWCTAKYNCNYGTRNKKVSESKYKPICQFSKDGTLIKIWDSAKQAADELNIDFRHISDCCKCKRKTAYGYKWHFHYKGLWIKKHIPLKEKKVA